jgi:two-component system, sporulation sensor kinase E
VADEGSGMDSETRENIFTPFYTKKKEGTGLGMPIVKKIVEAHKGKIYVHSRPGEGTEVRVELFYK